MTDDGSNEVGGATTTASKPMPSSPSQTPIVAIGGPCTAYAFRLGPGSSLRSSLVEAASSVVARPVGTGGTGDPLYHANASGDGDQRRETIRPSSSSGGVSGAVFVLTCVGSLSGVTIRLANHDRRGSDDGDSGGPAGSNDVRHYPDRRFEIVSLVGTFCGDAAKCHLHICLSDAEGDSIGGHLIEGTVFTTAEVVLGTMRGVEFDRDYDDRTGFAELVVRPVMTTGTSPPSAGDGGDGSDDADEAMAHDRGTLHRLRHWQQGAARGGIGRDCGSGEGVVIGSGGALMVLLTGVWIGTVLHNRSRR